MEEKAYHHAKLKIKSWAEEDRPREKLMLKGRANLSNAELLAILLGSGSTQLSAVGLAQHILNDFGQDLERLGKASVAEMKKFKGVGEAKAITILAAMELGRRRQAGLVTDRPKIKSSQDAYRVIAPKLLDLPHEEFWILLLNRSNTVTSKYRISTGGVSGTVVDAKMVFKTAVENLASSIILCHNHPSGNLQPSQADIDLTQKLKKAGVTLDCLVLDHLIIGRKGYYSFADEGML